MALFRIIPKLHCVYPHQLFPSQPFATAHQPCQPSNQESSKAASEKWHFSFSSKNPAVLIISKRLQANRRLRAKCPKGPSHSSRQDSRKGDTYIPSHPGSPLRKPAHVALRRGICPVFPSFHPKPNVHVAPEGSYPPPVENEIKTSTKVFSSRKGLVDPKSGGGEG